MPKNNANIPDIKTLIQAGINPVTGLPIKCDVNGNKGNIKVDIKKLLRIKDEQEKINIYLWDNTPFNLSSQEIERLGYYKAQLLMFRLPNDKFYLMPYALSGTIDFYGRFNSVHPVPISSGGKDKHKEKYEEQKKVLSGIIREVIYDEKEIDEKTDPDKVGIILWDYTRQLSETNIARADLQDPILDVMAECIPYMRTALSNSTGVEGMRVGTDDCASNVRAISDSINRASLNGYKFVPLVDTVEFQELTGGEVAKAEEFMQAMQSLDNFRKSLYGLENGGLFEKKAHMLEDEQQMNGGSTSLVIQDGLEIRQRFCELANKIWGLNMSVRINDAALQQMQEDDQEEPMNDEGGNEDE